jgi:hypothetical protein
MKTLFLTFQHKLFMISIQFLLSFVIFNVSAVGLAKLYLVLIQPNQLLSFMNRPLLWAQNNSKFIYKSIGGCTICTIQRCLDLSFIMIVLTNHVNYWLIFPLYCLYGGLGFYVASIQQEQKPQPKEIHQKIEL